MKIIEKITIIFGLGSFVVFMVYAFTDLRHLAPHIILPFIVILVMLLFINLVLMFTNSTSNVMKQTKKIKDIQENCDSWDDSLKGKN
jgi:hypothetical protein